MKRDYKTPLMAVILLLAFCSLHWVFVSAHPPKPRVEILDVVMRWGNPNQHQGIHPKIARFRGEFDGRTRSAIWIMEYLDGKAKTTERLGRSSFRMSKTIPRDIAPRTSDYTRSGYDRGHLAAAANHNQTKKGWKETFNLLNVVPQNPKLNRGPWKKIETAIRKIPKDGVRVWVIAGPLYAPEKLPKPGKKVDGLEIRIKLIGKRHISVPTHLYKAILVQKGDEVKLYAYIVPNKDVSQEFLLKKYAVSTDTVEYWSGLDFWSNLGRKARFLEREVNSISED